MTERPSSVEGITIPEARALSGASPRQLHHWINRGWLVSSRDGGWAHLLAPEEVSVARVMVHLIDVGFTVQKAASLARGIVQHGNAPLELSPEVMVTYRELGT